jgi:hypothetical protein
MGVGSGHPNSEIALRIGREIFRASKLVIAVSSLGAVSKNFGIY